MTEFRYCCVSPDNVEMFNEPLYKRFESQLVHFLNRIKAEVVRWEKYSEPVEIVYLNRAQCPVRGTYDRRNLISNERSS
ncbi:MAG: hypothetical protein AAF378_14895 [Cyanobacteria bacterium P01_A01_bin.84]